MDTKVSYFKGTQRSGEMIICITYGRRSADGRNTVMQYKECWTWDSDSRSNAGSLGKHLLSLNLKSVSSNTGSTALTTLQDYICYFLK